MKQKALRLARAMLPTLALFCLIGPFLGWGWRHYQELLYFPFSDTSDGLASVGMCVAFTVVLALVLPGFLRLRSLARGTKGLVLGGSLAFALVAALGFEPAAGGWVALGLTAQLAAGITWSERCHVMLGGRRWQRVAWAVVGVLVPMAVLALPIGALMAILYKGARMPLPLGYPVAFAASLFVLFVAAIHHLRARGRAQEWRLARETGEYPDLPAITTPSPPAEHR